LQKDIYIIFLTLSYDRRKIYCIHAYKSPEGAYSFRAETGVPTIQAF
jgi:hypothetical protein